MKPEYLHWNEKTISDFSEKNINSLYNEGYIFTRLSKGKMQQTRSVRIDLSKFALNSENRRVLKKIEGLNLNIATIPYKKYEWQIGKMAKDFYDHKFGADIFTANKIKELLTDKEKNNFNNLFVYNLSINPDENHIVGYAICFANSKIVHYSYPFYNLPPSPYPLVPNLGMGMMIMAIAAAKQNNMQYIYLGSAQRPTDVYKLQFAGLEWFDGKNWSNNSAELKKILKKII